MSGIINKISRFYLKKGNKNVQILFFSKNSLFFIMKLGSMKKKNCENFNISTNNITNVDTSKVLLYTVVIEDMSREIENHSSSSMCGHRSISQNTYMSFVWACLNTQFTSSVLHYVRPCLFVPWVVYTQASVFAAPPYIELLATNLMSFWGITTSTCSTISQQI